MFHIERITKTFKILVRSSVNWKKKIVLLWWLNETVVEFTPVLCSLNLAAIASDIEHYSATQIEPTTEMCSLWTESQVNGNHD